MRSWSRRSVIAQALIPRTKLDFAMIPDYRSFAPQSAQFQTSTTTDPTPVLFTPLVR